MRTFAFALAAAALALAAVGTGAADPPPPQHGAFDLEGHRGTRGLRPENTLAAFGKALQIGVTTLELDTGVTKDGVVGTQEAVPGTRMPSLAQVFKLANRYGAHHVKFDIETKIDPTVDDTVDPLTFTRSVLDVIGQYGMTHRSVLQSFDWRTLVESKRELPALKTVALAQASTIFPGTPWTAGVPIAADVWSTGTLANAAKSIAASAVSANYLNITDALISAAHRLGLLVIPWTVDDAAAMRSLIDRGVDGLITDYPDIGRQVMTEKGIPLPRQYTSPFDVEGHRGACDSLGDECSLEAVMGDASVKSPWTGGLDWWAYLDLGRLVSKAKADVVSSNWQVHDPNLGHVDSTDFYLKEDPAMFHGPTVDVLQRHYQLRVVPYTIDDEATMQRVIDLGVDGIISDDPDLLLLVAKRNGLA
jgi:glycerophosphoryl diester phosphodiesterase